MITVSLKQAYDDTLRDVRIVLAKYDAMSNWTCTETRFVEKVLGLSPSLAARLVRDARRTK